jgi:hypothetical protein
VCANQAAPANGNSAHGACASAGGATAAICTHCGYCHPCDWAWFGVQHCSGCGIGSDCAANFGVAEWCSICLDCANCCAASCSGPALTPPGQPTGNCTYCLATGVAVCTSCSDCVTCLYSRRGFDGAQDPWGLVICATSRQCGGCVSVAGNPPR